MPSSGRLPLVAKSLATIAVSRASSKTRGLKVESQVDGGRWFWLTFQRFTFARNVAECWNLLDLLILLGNQISYPLPRSIIFLWFHIHWTIFFDCLRCPRWLDINRLCHNVLNKIERKFLINKSSSIYMKVHLVVTSVVVSYLSSRKLKEVVVADIICELTA